MRFVTGQRAVVLGVGEFATFQPGPTNLAGGRTGAWRAAVGTAWHETLRARAAAVPGTHSEVPLAAKIFHRGWRFELGGRLDQVMTRDGMRVLREVKTVAGPVPRAPEDWRRTHPEFFRQLAAYWRMAELDTAFQGLTGEAPLAAELVLVDYATGFLQTVPLERDEAAHWLDAQCEVFFPYLEDRWASQQRLAALPARAAFAVLRPGQAEAQAALAAAAGHAGVVCFEAPTGFGKTGLLLEYALCRLRDGHAQRLVYLTGKGTGQEPVTRQLRALLGTPPELRHVQLRSRREHAIAAPAHTCDARGRCRDDLEARWQSAGLDLPAMFENGALPLEKARNVGAATGVCPYEITRAALPFAEMWICDYNYVFSPAHRGVLFGQPGFDPAMTLLILDEAHNLPARAADARSHALSAHAAAQAYEALQSAPTGAALAQAAGRLAEWLAELPPTTELKLTALYELADILEAIAAELRGGPPPEVLADADWDFLWGAAEALPALRDGALPLLAWAPAAGELRLDCLDAGPAISAALKEFGQSILTTATFGPAELFLPACGLAKDEVAWLAATAPWREGAYDVAVDVRVDTRFRARSRHWATTAQTIVQMAAGQARPVAVFFPSYDYAENVRTYVGALDALTRVAMQPRGADLAAQQEFLDEALLTAHAIFFVLGGSFAEGIDRLGGEVDRAIVVGPAPPEPNSVNEAKRARLEEELGPDEAFRRVYLAPGLLKVAQALGRLVRAPGQRAKVLLHCRRFAEPATRALLPAEYRVGPVFHSEAELVRWIG